MDIKLDQLTPNPPATPPINGDAAAFVAARRDQTNARRSDLERRWKNLLQARGDDELELIGERLTTIEAEFSQRPAYV